MSPSVQNIEETMSHSNAAVEPAWKKELNERLAATRSRRLRNLPEQVALPGLEALGQKGESRAARLAAKVAERYANVPTYSEMLAAEARARSHAAALAKKKDVSAASAAPTAAEVAAFPGWQLSLDAENASAPAAAKDEKPLVEVANEPEVAAAVEPLAVNLIEFPRELVASRKMRPRLAEGPLLPTEDLVPSVNIGPAPANWSPIRLDDDSVTTAQAARGPLPAQPMVLKTAPIEDRVMAAIFDLALIVAAFAVFVLVFVACTAHPPSGKPAVIAAALVLVGFALLYHYLFFRYAEGTPGMRYAKIALCTFEDENPSRQAMCRRVLFLLLSAAPLGLGFLWACFDEDRLGWHDRISRMYQRSYS